MRGKEKGVDRGGWMRIKSKRIIKLEESVPVYDITVPEHHNFALANGVIVHNSKDVMDAIVGSYWACKTAKRSGGIITVDKGEYNSIAFQKKLRQIKNSIAPQAKQLDPSVLMNFIKS